MERSTKVSRAVALGILCIAITILCTLDSSAQVTVSADGPGNTYELLESRGFGLETPDCGHNVRHVREVFDSTLGKNVFAFDAHRDLDNDRCTNFDRQRIPVATPTNNPIATTLYGIDRDTNNGRLITQGAVNGGTGAASPDSGAINNVGALGFQILATEDGGFAEYVRIPAAAIALGNVMALGRDVDPAVRSARRGFALWSRTPAPARGNSRCR